VTAHRIEARWRAIGDPLPRSLVALTLATGLVDAVSFLGLGQVFVANQTGNVVFLAFALAGASGLSASAALVSLLCFAVGSAGGGLLGRRQGGDRRRWVTGALFGEAALVVAATLAAIGVGVGEANARRELVIGLLALAMGFRNATVRRLGVPDMTTTVLTMTLTGLTSESPLGEGRGAAVRRAASVGAMFAGAIVGAALVVHDHLTPAMILLTAVVLATAAGYAVRPEPEAPRRAA
jgi:uncharacterized membrane protein YoaK (UPF0700 family)